VSAFSSFAVEAFDDHITNISVDVVIDGSVVKALPAIAELAPELDIGGVSDSADGALIFKKSDLGILPKVGSRIYIDGDSLRVRALLTSVGDPLVTIEYSGFTQR